MKMKLGESYFENHFIFFQVGVAILLNLVARSASTRTQLQKPDNLSLVINLFLTEKSELEAVHEGNVSLNMSRTT